MKLNLPSLIGYSFSISVNCTSFSHWVEKLFRLETFCKLPFLFHFYHGTAMEACDLSTSIFYLTYQKPDSICETGSRKLGADESHLTSCSRDVYWCLELHRTQLSLPTPPYTGLVGPLIRAAHDDYCWERKMKEPLAGQMGRCLETALTSPDHGRLKPEQARNLAKITQHISGRDRTRRMSCCGVPQR